MKKLSTKNRRPAPNSTYPKGGVFPLRRDRLCSADSLVVAESSVLRMKCSGENRHLRQPENVIAQCKKPAAQTAHLVLPDLQADPSQNQKNHFFANALIKTIS